MNSIDEFGGDEGIESLTELGGRGRKRGGSNAQKMAARGSQTGGRGMGLTREMSVLGEEAEGEGEWEGVEEEVGEKEVVKAEVKAEVQAEVKAKVKAEVAAVPPPGLQGGEREKATDLWECRCDPSSNYAFYVNKKTGEGAWTPPVGVTEEEQKEFLRQYQEFYQKIVLMKWQQQQAAVAAPAPAAAAGGKSTWAGAISAQQQQPQGAQAGGGQAEGQTQWDQMTPEQKAYYTMYYKAQAAKAAKEAKEGQ